MYPSAPSARPWAMGRGRRIRVNMGRADHWARLVLAGVLVLGGVLLGPWGWLPGVMYVLALVLVGTATLSFCPIYWLLGIRTCPLEQADPQDAYTGRH